MVKRLKYHLIKRMSILEYMKILILNIKFVWIFVLSIILKKAKSIVPTIANATNNSINVNPLDFSNLIMVKQIKAPKKVR